jgi:hypothetical protein
MQCGRVSINGREHRSGNIWLLAVVFERSDEGQVCYRTVTKSKATAEKSHPGRRNLPAMERAFSETFSPVKSFKI